MYASNIREKLGSGFVRIFWRKFSGFIRNHVQIKKKPFFLSAFKNKIFSQNFPLEFFTDDQPLQLNEKIQHFLHCPKTFLITV